MRGVKCSICWTGGERLCMRQHRRRRLPLMVVSWGWKPPLTPALSQGEREGPSRFVEGNEWQGTRDPAAYLSVPAAIQFHLCLRHRRK